MSRYAQLVATGIPTGVPVTIKQNGVQVPNLFPTAEALSPDNRPRTGDRNGALYPATFLPDGTYQVAWSGGMTTVTVDGGDGPPAFEFPDMATQEELNNIGGGGSGESGDVRWTANTAVLAGRIVHNAGIFYLINTNHTTPATFSTTNLTPVAGVVAIQGKDDVVKTGVVEIEHGDLQDSSSYSTTSEITGPTGYIPTAIAGINVAALTSEDVSDSSYTVVQADQGKLKAMKAGGSMTFTVPTDADMTGSFPVGAQIGVLQDNTGTLSITGTGSLGQIGTPWFESKSHNTAVNQFFIDIPAAKLTDHDGLLVTCEISNAKAITGPVDVNGNAIAGWTALDGGLGTGSGAGYNYVWWKPDCTDATDGDVRLYFNFASFALPGTLMIAGFPNAHRTNFIDNHGEATSATPGTKTAPATAVNTSRSIEVNIIGRTSGSTAASAQTAPSGITKASDAEILSSIASNNTGITIGYSTDLTGLTAPTTTVPRVWLPTPASPVTSSARTIIVKPHVVAGSELKARGLTAPFHMTGRDGMAVLTYRGADVWNVGGDIAGS